MVGVQESSGIVSYNVQLADTVPAEEDGSLSREMVMVGGKRETNNNQQAVWNGVMARLVLPSLSNSPVYCGGGCVGRRGRSNGGGVVGAAGAGEQATLEKRKVRKVFLMNSFKVTGKDV